MLFQTARYRVGATIMALSALTLAGCVALTPATPEQTVEKRAAEYWQARMTGKYEKAYELSTPAYRKLRSLEQFRQQFGGAVSVVSAEVVSVACEEQKCTARMKIGAKPALVGVKLGTMPMYLDEIWLLEEGQWWHYQES